MELITESHPDILPFPPEAKFVFGIYYSKNFYLKVIILKVYLLSTSFFGKENPT